MKWSCIGVGMRDVVHSNKCAMRHHVFFVLLNCFCCGCLCATEVQLSIIWERIVVVLAVRSSCVGKHRLHVQQAILDHIVRSFVMSHIVNPSVRILQNMDKNTQNKTILTNWHCDQPVTTVEQSGHHCRKHTTVQQGRTQTGLTQPTFTSQSL